MSLVVNQRAKKLFKRDHPDRFWDLIAIKSTGGRGRSATAAERQRYLAQARAELFSEGKEAADIPRGPKREKRPGDVIGNAVHVMKIATGEI